MNKNNASRYICSKCSYQTVKWLGCCPACHSWETLVACESTPSPKSPASHKPVTLTNLATLTSTPQKRFLSGIKEWDRVVGNGIMPSSLLVVTGDPGIGKSTLLLQLSSKLANRHTVYYFSTEESLHQVKERATRLASITSNSDTLLFSDQADLNGIIAISQKNKPDLIIIDSIQNCLITTSSASAPGSVAQLREASFQLMRLAKEHGITVIISGHINKDGAIAGPKTLEHMVDAVFYLQGEDRWQTRVLRGVKNRFGTINELGFFEMTQHGLQEVPDINELLLQEFSYSPGSSLVSVLEGSRPLLLELQALAIESKLGIPQRVISGVDHKQVVLIAAILEKYLHVKFSAHDLFFKVTGGFKTKSSATDLGIALALLSSYFQQPLPKKSLCLGEIGLTGQIKPINQITSFTQEAQKFGIRTLIVAHNQHIEKTGCSIKHFCHVYELLTLFSEKTANSG